jgi:hypothetical protein
VAGCLFALAVRPIVASLHLSTPGLILSLWLLLFVLGFLLSMIEAWAFADGPSPVGTRDVLGALAASAVVASVAGLMIRSASPGSLLTNVRQWIEPFGWRGFAVRLFCADLAFMVAYCVIGTVAWRFVRPYYSDPKLGLRLRVPSGPVVVLLQLGRGLLALVALLPLLASSSARGFDGWVRFSLALAVTSGVVPLLGAAGWPAYLRVVHGVEIVVFDLVFAFALWKLFRL